MKRFLVAIGFLLTLTGLGLGSAVAYEFSATERSLADNPTLNPSNSVPQWQRDAAQARQQEQALRDLHQSVPQFNPRDYTPSMPFSLYQNGRVQTCRRGFNNSIYCN